MRVTGSHHVLGVKHLLGEPGHHQGLVLLAALDGHEGKAGHEEAQAGEGHRVDIHLLKISIEQSRKSQAGGDPAPGVGHLVVQITVGGCGQL